MIRAAALTAVDASAYTRAAGTNVTSVHPAHPDARQLQMDESPRERYT
jgi:hypothetical protein